ncbi:related to 60s ribosomal protein L2 (mitochondrial) [Ramularia collo-cygni]|uniref:Large ribosomal subunit protein bL27m n=1 Tax=Ramularia collo-cygni TaxID=112498 RepID=A0A2D3V1U7_9PEZI|nr:related to 60s ribosomal protein L2 (mitochondrial) [Ramularia collo-cygni]CZT21778.1 related to 60s ribosomal protein L2 (mitochondrial) [Ramularia collo-cygni]
MAPTLSSRAPSTCALSALSSALSSLRLQSLPSVRHASHQAQGRANGAKDGPGKRLGAKKTGGEYVVPGNILYKQRGTLWFPGENCMMGRDHTIHAAAPGYVRYYRDPNLHPKRKYIGVVFKKEHTLPQAPNAVRRRQLGMLAYQSKDVATPEIHSIGDLTHEEGSAPAAIPSTKIRQKSNDDRDVTILRGKKGDTHEVVLHMKGRGQYRQANWEIGRAAEFSQKARDVEPFVRGDRFMAWRKASKRKAANAERRSMGRGGKKAKGGGGKK